MMKGRTLILKRAAPAGFQVHHRKEKKEQSEGNSSDISGLISSFHCNTDNIASISPLDSEIPSVTLCATLKLYCGMTNAAPNLLFKLL